MTKMTLRFALVVALLGGLPLLADLVVPEGPPRLTGSWSQTFFLTGMAQVDKFVATKITGPATLFKNPGFDNFSNGFANWTITPLAHTNIVTATSNTGSVPAPLQFSLHFTPTGPGTVPFSFQLDAYDGPTIRSAIASWNNATATWSFAPSTGPISLPEPSMVVLQAGWLAGVAFLVARRRKEAAA